MELFFTNEDFKVGCKSMPEIPFIVDDKFRLMCKVNDFFIEELVPDGRTSSPKTWKNYAYWILDYLRWLNSANLDWLSISRLELSAYRDWSLEDCQLKPATVNSRLTAIKRLYDFAQKRGWVEVNPIQTVAVVRKRNADSDFLSHTNDKRGTRNDLFLFEQNELPKIYSPLEIERLFKKTTSKRLKLMMLLMLECGLRREEIVKLPLSLVLDLEREAQMSGRESVIEVVLPRSICKGNKSRVILMSHSTAMKLRQYRATVRPAFVKAYRKKNKGKTPNNFWITQLGTELSVETLTTEVSRAGEIASVENANPHKFRHTFATNLYELTGDIRLVQKLLGHSHIQTTTIYEHTAGVDRKGFLEDYQKEIDSLVGEFI